MKPEQREFIEAVEERGETEASCVICGFVSTIDDLYEDPGVWYVVDDDQIECDACREARRVVEQDNYLDYYPDRASGPDYWQNDAGEWRCG